GLAPYIEQQCPQQGTQSYGDGGTHGREDDQGAQEAARAVASSHHDVRTVGGVALVDGELARQDDDVANRQTNHHAGHQRGAEVLHWIENAGPQQQGGHAQADAGLDGAAYVQDPHQGALYDAGKQEAGAKGRHSAVGTRVHAGFQHGDEGHLVEGADTVQVVHVGSGKDPGRQQADEDGEGPVCVPEVVFQFLIHGVAPYLLASRLWTFS